MAKKLHTDVKQLISNESLRKEIKIQEFVTDKVGIPTLKDIMQELAKPGRDPLEQFEEFAFDKNINSINDLIIGMVVPGIITNITNFGCFVDIGVHQDGLIHVSQLANKVVSNPSDVVKLGQKVLVKVTDVDMNRKRISLSMKEV